MLDQLVDLAFQIQYRLKGATTDRLIADQCEPGFGLGLPRGASGEQVFCARQPPMRRIGQLEWNKPSKPYDGHGNTPADQTPVLRSNADAGKSEARRARKYRQDPNQPMTEKEVRWQRQTDKRCGTADTSGTQTALFGSFPDHGDGYGNERRH